MKKEVRMRSKVGKKGIAKIVGKSPRGPGEGPKIFLKDSFSKKSIGKYVLQSVRGATVHIGI